MSQRIYPHLADRLLNTPLLLHPQKLDAIIAGLGQRLLGVDGIQIDPATLGAGAALPAEMFTTRRGVPSAATAQSMAWPSSVPWAGWCTAPGWRPTAAC